jgi:endonuclease YncB( thermonuclease family)
LTFVLIVLVWSAAPLVAQQTDTKPAQPRVVRETVLGSINHGGGDTKWLRLRGRARVLDAKTLELADGTQINLDLTTPNLKQLALNEGTLYPCGQEAAEFLRQLIGEQPVMCFGHIDRDEPSWWNVYVGDTNLERAMVVGGWALADHSSLHADEIIARENKRGLWRGKFVHPDDWRAGVRLPGEPPPDKLTSQREAQALINEFGESPEAAAAVLARIVRDLPDIRRLDLPGGTTDTGLGELIQLATLEELTWGGSVTDAGLVHLKALPRLKRLGLTNRIGDAGLVYLRSLTDLTHVDLDWSRLTDAGIEHLAGLTRLESLNLGHTEITDAGLAHLKSMQRLRWLGLSYSKVGDTGLAHLSGLANLVVLDVHQTRITDAGLVHLAKLKNLAFLDVGGNGITDAGIEALASVRSLRVLHCDERVSDQARQRLKAAIPELQFDGTPESAGYQP